MTIETIFLVNDFIGVACGLLFNMTLYFLIEKESPLDLKSYKRLLRLHCITDLIYTFINGFNSLRIIYSGNKLLIVSCGLLSHWSFYGFRIGFAIFTFAFFSELTSVPIDYYYRFMLVCRNDPFTNLRFAFCLLTAALVSAIYVCFSLNAITFGPSAETNEFLPLVFDALEINNPLQPFGFMDPKSLRMAMMLTAASATALIVYSIIGLTTYCIHRKLAQNAKEQKRGESKHVKQITLLMIFQAALPTCGLCAPIILVTFFTIMELSPHAIGYFITISIPWTPSLKPLITIYIIRPYRRALKRKFLGSKSVKPTEVSVTVYDTQRRRSTRKTVTIILISFVFAALLDRFVDFIHQKLLTKRATLLFISCLYVLAIGLSIGVFASGRDPLYINDNDVIKLNILMGKMHSNPQMELNRTQACHYNSLLFAYDHELKGCTDKTPPPTDSIVNQTTYTFYPCRVENSNLTKGKRILVIGNSHARHAFSGIAHHFKNISSYIELYSVSICAPFDFDKHTLNPYTPECDVFINGLQKRIQSQQWDVIIIIYRFYNYNVPITQDDPYILEMRKLYSLADKYTKDAVVVPGVNLMMNFSAYESVMHRCRIGQKLDGLSLDLKDHWHYARHYSKRVHRATCSKCLLIKWPEADFCDQAQGYCNLVHPLSKLSLFMDGSHVSSVGSDSYGRLIRDRFNKFVKSRQQIGEQSNETRMQHFVKEKPE